MSRASLIDFGRSSPNRYCDAFLLGLQMSLTSSERICLTLFFLELVRLACSCPKTVTPSKAALRSALESIILLFWSASSAIFAILAIAAVALCTFNCVLYNLLSTWRIDSKSFMSKIVWFIIGTTIPEQFLGNFRRRCHLRLLLGQPRNVYKSYQLSYQEFCHQVLYQKFHHPLGKGDLLQHLKPLSGFCFLFILQILLGTNLTYCQFYWHLLCAPGLRGNFLWQIAS